MVNKVFTCPYCRKEASSWLEPPDNSIFSVAFTLGHRPLLKEKCNYCSGALAINRPHVVLLNLLHLLCVIGFIAGGILIHMYGASINKEDFVMILAFCIGTPGIFVFYFLIFPAAIGMMGLRLYKAR